jgi:hypothetical protein
VCLICPTSDTLQDMNTHRWIKVIAVGVTAFGLSAVASTVARADVGSLTHVASNVSANSGSVVHHMTWPANTTCGGADYRVA